MNERTEDFIARQVYRIVQALESKQTIVPMFIFVPQQITSEQIHQISKMIRDELEKAGFKLPEPTNG